MASPWEIISNYESAELVREALFRKHARQANAGQARELCAAFNQARAYFESAATASRAVKPLVLYYGIAALSRGLSLFLTGRREATLSPSHGLCTRDWNSELSAASPDIASLQISATGGGTFVNLMEATENRSLLRGGTNVANTRWPHPPLNPQEQVALGDLLARLPDVREQYRRWKGSPMCARFSVVKLSETQCEVSIHKGGGVLRSCADAIFLGTDFTLIAENDDAFQYRGSNNSSIGVSDCSSEDVLGLGTLYLTAKFPSGSHLSKIGISFAISYVLGMLVRYFPSAWMGLIQHQKSDASLPTILTSIEILEHEFPKMVVDFLEPPPMKVSF